MQMQNFEKLVVNGPLWNWLLRTRYLPRLFRLVDDALARSGLELGCGQGLTTEEILKRFPNLHVTALDYDPNQVSQARQRLARFSERVRVEQGDATALGFSDSRFDAVFACNVFHHIQNYQEALQEASRVLTSGGKLYVMDLDRRFFNPLFKRLFPPEVLFSREEFLHDLQAVGFTIESSTGSQWVFFVRASKPTRQAHANIKC